MDISYVHTLSVPDYLRLRSAVGWAAVSPRQAEAAIRNSVFLVAAVSGGETVASARLVSDGGTVFYLADVMVLPDSQGRGIGKHMVLTATEHVRSLLAEGESARITLTAAKGRESFYRPLGFEAFPSEQFGAGMGLRIEKRA